MCAEGPETDSLTQRIIAWAIEVHRQLGPGLLEGIYESALSVEMELRGLSFERQLPVPIVYKGRPVGDYRLDLIVDRQVVVEVKAVERHDPVFDAQGLTYLRASGCRTGLLINFNSKLLVSGIKRFVL
jgi:GxxExxY protein